MTSSVVTSAVVPFRDDSSLAAVRPQLGDALRAAAAEMSVEQGEHRARAVAPPLSSASELEALNPPRPGA